MPIIHIHICIYRYLRMRHDPFGPTATRRTLSAHPRIVIIFIYVTSRQENTNSCLCILCIMIIYIICYRRSGGTIELSFQSPWFIMLMLFFFILSARHNFYPLPPNMCSERRKVPLYTIYISIKTQCTACFVHLLKCYNFMYNSIHRYQLFSTLPRLINFDNVKYMYKF